MIAIIDYDLSNINSIFNAVNKISKNVKVVKRGENLSEFDKLILRRSFPAAVENLKKNLFNTLKEILENKTNFRNLFSMQLI